MLDPKDEKIEGEVNEASKENISEAKEEMKHLRLLKKLKLK